MIQGLLLIHNTIAAILSYVNHHWHVCMSLVDTGHKIQPLSFKMMGKLMTSFVVAMLGKSLNFPHFISCSNNNIIYPCMQPCPMYFLWLRFPFSSQLYNPSSQNRWKFNSIVDYEVPTPVCECELNNSWFLFSSTWMPYKSHSSSWPVL